LYHGALKRAAIPHRPTSRRPSSAASAAAALFLASFVAHAVTLSEWTTLPLILFFFFHPILSSFFPAVLFFLVLLLFFRWSSLVCSEHMTLEKRLSLESCRCSWGARNSIARANLILGFQSLGVRVNVASYSTGIIFQPTARTLRTGRSTQQC
jgi:hypothetical protein